MKWRWSAPPIVDFRFDLVVDWTGILSNACSGDYPSTLEAFPAAVTPPPPVTLPQLHAAIMFTGLVETMGTLTQITDQPPGKRLAVQSPLIANDVQLGDSICVNGCCLTVVSAAEDVVEFEAGEETLSRTNLGNLAVGGKVNLERSLRAGDRLGGHYVTGHIDATGELIQRREDPPWAYLHFRLPASLASQVASKGSVAIDGVSLTVVDVEKDEFSVALIPHTLSVTTLGALSVGDPVNLETDVLAKYVERALDARLPGSDSPKSDFPDAQS